jgi:NAD-dependent dihydropyrimidine dehydrogenase PreA subunit
MTTATLNTRKIVKIDENLCDGCGACVPSCAEGAIRIIDGKARLVADNLCDGLGNCLGTCPKGAIAVEERPAAEFDESAVEARKATEAAAGTDEAFAEAAETPAEPMACGCPGTMMRKLNPHPEATGAEPASPAGPASSRLGQWPVQLALLPTGGDLWNGADVLLSADCAAYAMGDFHARLLAGRALAVACPKLDDTEPYVAKLARVFAGNDIRSITIARMEVPCCGGLEAVVRQALDRAGKDIPLTVVVVGVEGEIQSVNGLSVA